jgi:hypothetical protein
MAGTTRHEGDVELIHAVAMGMLLIDISCLWIFRQADQVDPQKIRESCFIRLREVCLKMQAHMCQTAGIIGKGALIFTG